MIIRAKTFKQWMQANLDKGQISELAEHGADTGWPGLTYYSDTVKLYDRFHTEIWEALNDDAQDFSEPNVMAFIASFTRAEDITDHDILKNHLVWYYAERTARELSDS